LVEKGTDRKAEWLISAVAAVRRRRKRSGVE